MEQIRKCFSTKANDVTKEGIVTVAVNGIGIEDAQHDISMPGSFVNTLKDMTRKRWLYNHDFTQLLGVPLRGEETKEDLIMVGKINLNKQLGRDVLSDYELYAENDRTLEHSIGVIALKRNPSNRKEVLEWQLNEYSTLSAWGANPRTSLVSIKSDREQIRDRADFIRKALKHHGYSDERLEKFDMELNLLLKSLEGDTIVRCPLCGHEFDYDQQPQHTAREEIRDMAIMYTRWIADDTVYDHIQELKPEIQSEVLAILDTFKGTRKDLTEKAVLELMEYVRCPKCWARVYRSDTILNETQKTEEPKDDDSQEKQDEEVNGSEDKKGEGTEKSFWTGIGTIFK